jgi:hypothetical protein
MVSTISDFGRWFIAGPPLVAALFRDNVKLAVCTNAATLIRRADSHSSVFVRQFKSSLSPGEGEANEEKQ